MSNAFELYRPDAPPLPPGLEAYPAPWIALETARDIRSRNWSRAELAEFYRAIRAQGERTFACAIRFALRSA